MTLDLTAIDPSKKCLDFLQNRILVDNYRGIQISQHNRYTYQQVFDMLKIIFDLVGLNKMTIRTTDLSKRPYNYPDEYIYAVYTDRVNKLIGKSTQDSIRKNLFVDFHRMGLITIYNEDGVILDPYDKNETKKYISLTDLAISFINSTTSLEKQMIFSRCLDNLLLGLATDMLETFKQIDNLTLDEYTFFISFLRQPLNGVRYDMDTLINFTLEYRALSKHQREHVAAIIQEYCKPKNFGGNKINKRDYHNWKNESQQIFMLLAMTPYFEFDKQNKYLKLMVKRDSVFTSQEDIKKLKRSFTEKNNYFKEHLINKTLGFELHHIVPLLWARSVLEFFLLDTWQNMLYIDGGNHTIITQSGNTYTRLDFKDNSNNILLINAFDNKLELVYNTNVLYDINKKKTMSEKNADLLSSY